MKNTFQIKRVVELPIGPIDPKAQAYVDAYLRMMTNAFSIQTFYGCSIERAREMAREQLSDADRALLATSAERVELLALPEPSGA